MRRPLGARPWLEWIVDTIAGALDFGRETGMYKHDVEPAALVAFEIVNQQVGAHAFSCPGRAPAPASRLLTGAGRAARLALPVQRAERDSRAATSGCSLGRARRWVDLRIPLPI